jgi:hypothetical protein
VTVSLLRASIGDAAISPANTSSAPAVVFTFAPQIAAAHAALLTMLGLPAAGAGLPGETDESAVVNSRNLAMLESLLTLALVWSAAAALAGEGSGAALRAESYRKRASRERQVAAAKLDLDGDGVADAQRRAAAGEFVRE